MPNHVLTRLQFSGDQEKINQLMATVRSMHSDFDFNNILAMPPELVGTTSPPRVAAGQTEEEFETYKAQLREKYGAVDWYEWAVENWETKWNAYEVVTTPNQIEFQTAWSYPRPIIETLAGLYPEVLIDAKWSDEDTGNNVGHIVYEGGEIQDDDIQNDSVEAREIVFELKPDTTEYYEWNEDHTGVSAIDEEEED